ncbi:DUF3784 domain-containing protein [Neobacillus sp. FSL H8-0543]|uniref:DUF3784 domain-containing protein n=1 Tax=Neobacillus sp. FSL H8-0543 TaxID=2954672 RepID=UPI0031586422
MFGLIATQLIVAIVFLLLGWVIRKKKMYSLISGFATRPKEEQEQLVKNGYPQKAASLLMATAIGMIVLLPLSFTSFIYATEVQFGFMMIFLLGGFVYLSRYEVVMKRKRSYMISTMIATVVIGGLVAISLFSYQGYELITKDDRFEITGMYGDEWVYEDIISIELMEEMPEVTIRTNGVGLPTLSKGHFKVKDYGSSLLFIQKGSSPYIYIELKEKKIFFNDKEPEQTRNWYEQISEKTGMPK